MRSVYAIVIVLCFMPFALSIDTPKKVKTDLEAMEGTWVWDADYDHPKIEPQIDVERVVVKGNNLKIEYFCEETTPKRWAYEAELVLRSEASPKEFDFKSIYAPDKGKVKTIGIYEIKDGKLIIAYRGADSTRPKGFQDKQDGNNGTIYIWLKKAK